ncbi:calpain-8-like [Hyperolius riggenbachi]|uniref:calpain-8-like n=1 Tax=Hyperolius riggenbachi TaxID=752182 RepID=UPI0035A2A9FB
MMAPVAAVGTHDNPKKYQNQDFDELRAKHLASKTLFEDDQFPAGAAALGYSSLGPNSKAAKGVEWKRPKEIHNDPHFIVGGATRGDVAQGALSDCWVLAGISSLTLEKDLLAQVVPQDQSFKKDYAGIFHFRMWQYGEWVDVVVDDHLPTKNKRLMFVQSADGSEFWSALLEKAYAKLNGSYEALNNGYPKEALEDFTGGISESYMLDHPPADLFQTIQNALKEDSLIGCYTKASPGGLEYINAHKLVALHAYSLTGAEEVDYKGKKVLLVRVMNPWGSTEWNAAWSDNAPEWNDVDPKVKEALLIKKDDGEFWMPFSDFTREFGGVEICNLTPDATTINEKSKWCTAVFSGSWVGGSTAGGNKDYFETFWTNPQYYVNLEKPDEDAPPDDPYCTIVVGLMQKNRRNKRKLGQYLLSIGFTLYKIPQEVCWIILYARDAARPSVCVP